jgi:hypothetical protein
LKARIFLDILQDFLGGGSKHFKDYLHRATNTEWEHNLNFNGIGTRDATQQVSLAVRQQNNRTTHK